MTPLKKRLLLNLLTQMQAQTSIQQKAANAQACAAIDAGKAAIAMGNQVSKMQSLVDATNGEKTTMEEQLSTFKGQLNAIQMQTE